MTRELPLAVDEVDLAVTFRENFNPKAKWRSAFTGIKAANRFGYFGSRTSTNSSGGWKDVLETETSGMKESGSESMVYFSLSLSSALDHFKFRYRPVCHDLRYRPVCHDR